MNTKEEEASVGVLIPTPTKAEVGRKIRLADIRTLLSVIPKEEAEAICLREGWLKDKDTIHMKRITKAEGEEESGHMADLKRHWKVLMKNRTILKIKIQSICFQVS